MGYTIYCGRHPQANEGEVETRWEEVEQGDEKMAGLASGRRGRKNVRRRPSPRAELTARMGGRAPGCARDQ